MSFADLETWTIPTASTAGPQLPACLGYAHDDTGTRAIMDVLGSQQTHAGSAIKPMSDVATRYKAILWLLPSDSHIDRLVRFFFAEISWQYDVVDEDVFREQLSSWRRVSYASRSNQQGLDPENRWFPALLFQILVQAVLHQLPGNDEFLQDLKRAPGMEPIDLATELSDAGQQILSLLESAEPTLAKVQAGLQRATFLKMTGSVIEAWRILGGAIRDAQELGLHRLYKSSRLEVWKSVEQSRLELAGRKVWLVLHLWDAHMGVVLGRPMITKLDPSTVPFPCHGVHGDDGVSGVQQVTPFDMILCGYHAAYKHLQDIHSLDPSKSDALETVGRIHTAVLAGIDHMPQWARSTSLLHDYKSPWLPAGRETLVTEINFTLLALHRPFIFAQPRNRKEALKAAVQVLQSQRRLFCAVDPRKFPSFNLVFATFDATVVVVAIFVLFPKENQERLQDSLQCVEWAVDRLRAMKIQSTLAASAYTAIYELYEKLLASISGVAASHVPPQSSKSQVPSHIPEQPLSDRIGFASSQAGLAPTMAPDLEQILFGSSLYDTDLHHADTESSIRHPDVVAASTHEADTTIHDSLVTNHEYNLPLLSFHELLAHDTSTDCGWL